MLTTSPVKGLEAPGLCTARDSAKGERELPVMSGVVFGVFGHGQGLSCSVRVEVRAGAGMSTWMRAHVQVSVQFVGRYVSMGGRPELVRITVSCSVGGTDISSIRTCDGCNRALRPDAPHPGPRQPPGLSRLELSSIAIARSPI